MQMQYDSGRPFTPALTVNEHKPELAGVHVSEAFAHQGFGGASYVEVGCDYPQIWCASLGNIVPAEIWIQTAAQDTRLVLAQIDALLAELAAHRQRLAGELAALEARAPEACRC
jgi:hypothetical protein